MSLQGLCGFSEERRGTGAPGAGKDLSGGKNVGCRRQPSYASSSVTGLQGQIRSLERLLLSASFGVFTVQSSQPLP